MVSVTKLALLTAKMNVIICKTQVLASETSKPSLIFFLLSVNSKKESAAVVTP
jgi:hypothetical protein